MTTLNLSTISPHARERYIRLGRRFGSNDTLKQAAKTLDALASHASALADCGFGPDDVAHLASARETLGNAGVGRETKTTESKVTRKEYIKAVAYAKSARNTARTILANVVIIFDDGGNDGPIQQIESILSRSNSLPVAGQDEALAIQLDLLAAIFSDSTIADAAKTRGGDKALTNLQDAAVQLRATAEEREGSGTRLSTEEMDLLDGIIVTYCRAARNAAKQAARNLGSPALLDLFALTHITYTSQNAATAPGQTTSTPGTPPATP